MKGKVTLARKSNAVIADELFGDMNLEENTDNLTGEELNSVFEQPTTQMVGYAAMPVANNYDELINRLNVPVPDDKTSGRQQAGRTFKYISGTYAIRMMNDLFGNLGWSTEVKDITAKEVGDKTLYYATLSVTANGITKEDVGFGVTTYAGADGHETAIKGSITDAFKRCVRMFGEALGLSLYPDMTENAQRPAYNSNGNAQAYNQAPQTQAPQQTFAPAPQRVEPAQSNGVDPKCEICSQPITAFGDRTGQQWADARKQSLGVACCGRCSAKIKRGEIQVQR
jgi:hypothetical protein